MAVFLDLLAGEIQFTKWSPVVEFQEKVVPRMVSLMNSTFLAEWKDGKVIALFQTKVENIVVLMCKVILSFAFLLIIPIIHPPIVKTVFSVIKRASFFRVMRFSKLLNRRQSI